MTRPPHLIFIADIGGPETYHVGDEAMLTANLDAFRQHCPDLVATIVSRDPAWSAQRYGTRALAPIGFPTAATAGDETRNVLLARLLSNLETAADDDPWGREAIAVVAAADGVVVSGGGNLSATWPEHLYERVAFAELAYRLGKPVVFVGQTIGPDLSPALETLLAQTLRQARVVGVRELSSVALALNLGVAPRCLIYQTDDALFLQATPVEDAWAMPLRRGDRPWIAVTIDPFAPAREAAPILDALAAQLARLATYTGAQLVFIPHVASANHEADAGADLGIGRALCDRLPASTKMVMCDVLEARRTYWLTGQADLILSTRYHPLVFGLAAGIPGLGLFTDEYRRVKLQGVLAHANLANCCLSLTQAVEGRLFDMAQALWDRRTALRQELLGLSEVWRERERWRWQTIVAALNLSGSNDSPRNETRSTATETIPGFTVQPLVGHLFAELEGRRGSLLTERIQAARRVAQAEEYALSLVAEQTTLKAFRAEAERYARSLEVEYRQLTEQFAQVERYALSLENERTAQILAGAAG